MSGLPHDFRRERFACGAGAFCASTHDKVRIEARAERNSELIKRVSADGQLDFALVWQDERVTRYLEKVAELPLVWVGQPGLCEVEPRSVLPLAAFDAPCMFRAAATAALDKIGQPWHLSFTTPSLAGLWAAVESGLGLAVRTPIGVPRHLALLGKAEKLPPLPTSVAGLYRLAGCTDPGGEPACRRYCVKPWLVWSMRRWRRGHSRPGSAERMVNYRRCRGSYTSAACPCLRSFHSAPQGPACDPA